MIDGRGGTATPAKASGAGGSTPTGTGEVPPDHRDLDHVAAPSTSRQADPDRIRT
ncbi:MAG: hypothetical protein GX643_14220 [Acidimicrobiales bacterium]|nr:hypothetical protein [Acidimicrobiales bacterium]